MLVVLTALALRVTYVLQMRASPFFDHHVLDAAYHDEWATAIANGKQFVDGPYFRAPLYPWLLGAVYSVFGRDPLVPRLIQACLGAASCGLIFLLGRLVFSRVTAALASFAAATYWVFCYFDAELLIVPLIVFLDTLLLISVYWANRRPRWARWLVAGTVLGLSAIARPNILVFVPVVILWVFVVQRRKALVFVPSLVLGCLLPILPITMRNYVVGGDFVLISSQAGVNFFIGNNADSDGVTAVVPGTPADWWGGYFESIRLAELAEGRPLKPSEVSQYYFHKGLRYWAEQPQRAIALFVHKLMLFWSPYELGNNKSPRFFAERYGPIVDYLPLSFALIGPLGVIGMAVTWREWRRFLPLWGFVIVYMLGVVAFFVNSRYRVPLLPVLILFAAETAVWAFRSLRQRRVDRVVVAAGVAGCIALVMYRGSDGAKALSEAPSHALLAAFQLDHGAPEEAVHHLRRWCRIEPDNPEAFVQLAIAQSRMGKPDEAITTLEQVLQDHPHDTPALLALSDMLADDGKYARAIGLLRDELIAEPRNMRIANQLARLLATSPDAALRNGQEAMRLAQAATDATAGGVPETLDTLAAANAEIGRFDEAHRIAQRARQLAEKRRQHDLADAIGRRMALYADGKPYRRH